jgi:hypothetical protein
VNYDRILAQRENIQNRREAGGKVFVRSYDYEEDHILFNVSVEGLNAASTEHRSSIRLLPITRADLAGALMAAGFTDVASFGSIAMGPFEPRSSADLVLLAR